MINNSVMVSGAQQGNSAEILQTRILEWGAMQGILTIQESNPGLLHCRQIRYHVNHWGSPYMYPFSHKDFLKVFLKLIFHSWSIVDLQCYVSFCYTTK